MKGLNFWLQTLEAKDTRVFTRENTKPSSRSQLYVNYEPAGTTFKWMWQGCGGDHGAIPFWIAQIPTRLNLTMDPQLSHDNSLP